jgi:hypothetical protein
MPTLQAINPISNTHTAPANTNVSISYDEAIDLATVSTQTFAVHAMETGLLGQTYSVDGGQIQLTPSQPFKPGVLVKVSATTGTLNLSGQGPISPTVWQFRAAVTVGSGVFTSGSWVVASNGSAVAVGDLDGDGNLDAFIGTTAIGSQVWLNNGDGTFSDSTQSLGNANTDDVALGDLDGDGDLDAFVVNLGENDEVWLNNGRGTFQLGQSINSLHLWTRAVFLGDVDGDGDLDALVGGQLTAAVWLNDGVGTFSDSGQSLLDSSDIWAVALGDLDGDGDLDALVGNGTFRVWMNDSLGSFTDSGQNVGSGKNVALGDVDGDYDLDVLTGDCCFDPNEIWLNDGGIQGGTPGSFSYSGQFLSVGGSSASPVTFGDVDGDGDLDALVGFADGRGDRVWLNDEGTFVDSDQSLGSSRAKDVTLGDLDGDGDLDAFVLGSSGQVWLNHSGDSATSMIYLPIVLKPPATNLSVQNLTAGTISFTVYNTPQGNITCSDIPAGATRYCGSFTPGTYQVRVDTEQCGSGTGWRTFPPGDVTWPVTCP